MNEAADVLELLELLDVSLATVELDELLDVSDATVELLELEAVLSLLFDWLLALDALDALEALVVELLLRLELEALDVDRPTVELELDWVESLELDED